MNLEGKWRGKQDPLEIDEDGEWPQACSQEHEVKGRQSMGGVVEKWKMLPMKSGVRGRESWLTPGLCQYLKGRETQSWGWRSRGK